MNSHLSHEDEIAQDPSPDLSCPTSSALQAVWQTYRTLHPTLQDWTLAIEPTRNAGINGTCHYSEKQIVLDSRYLTSRPLLEQITTLTHEVAHALVGRGHRHGKVWKDQARALGMVNPKASSGGAVDLAEGDIPDQKRMQDRYKWFLVRDRDDVILAGWKRKPKYEAGYRIAGHRASELSVVQATDYFRKLADGLFG